TLSKQENVHREIANIIALPLILPNEINNCMENIIDELCNYDSELEKLTNYVIKNYIEDARFSSAMWNNFDTIDERPLGGPDQMRLLKYLLTDNQHQAITRPVQNDSDTLHVTINLALQHIIDFDEKNEAIVISGWLSITSSLLRDLNSYLLST
ncbi:unnamed protein product, partial [Rotaria sordida]